MKPRRAYVALMSTAVMAFCGGWAGVPAAEASSASVNDAVPALPAANSWVYGWAAGVVRVPGAAGRLIRISPDARTRDVGPVPSDTKVVDVSHDARRIITNIQLSDQLEHFNVWDSLTGGRYQVTLPSDTGLAFGPNGGLVSFSEDAGVILRDKYGTPTGKSFKTLRAADTQSDVSPGGSVISYIYGEKVVVASLITGKILRLVAQPPEPYCEVLGLWSDGSTKIRCGDDPINSAVYTVNSATGITTERGTPHQLGQVVPTEPLVGTSENGGDGLYNVSSNPVTTVPLTGPWGSERVQVSLLGGRQASAFLLAGWGASPHTALVRVNVATGSTTTLEGPGTADSRQLLDVFVVDGLN